MCLLVFRRLGIFVVVVVVVSILVDREEFYKYGVTLCVRGRFQYINVSVGWRGDCDLVVCCGLWSTRVCVCVGGSMRRKSITSIVSRIQLLHLLICLSFLCLYRFWLLGDCTYTKFMLCCYGFGAIGDLVFNIV